MPDIDHRSEVARLLEQNIQVLAAAQVAAARTVSSYDPVPDEVLLQSARRNVDRAVSVLTGVEPEIHEWSEDEQSDGGSRALQGIPSEDVLAVYRAAMAVIRDAFVADARSLGVPVEVVADGLTALWKLTDDNSRALVRGRVRADIEFARRQDRQRQTTLRRMLDGQLSSGEIVAAGATYGLRPDAEYWIARGHPLSGSLAGHRMEYLAVGAPRAPLYFDVSGDIAIVIPHKLVDLPDDIVVGQVGPVRVSGFHDAFVRATRTLNAALRYRMHGAVDSESLGLKLAVVEQEDVSRALVEELIAPVRDGSDLAPEILNTVRIFLENSRRYQQTAVALSMHVNTLRYRLQKYEELTGADLSATEGVVKVWWALQAWSAGIGAMPEPPRTGP